MKHPNDSPHGRSHGTVTWILVTLLLGAGGVAMAVKWTQDSARSAAMRGLRNIGVRHSVHGGVGGSPSSHSFRATRPVTIDADVDVLIEHVAALAQPYDLGLSPGETIRLIDLSATTTTPAAVEKLRRAFPSTEVRD